MYDTIVLCFLWYWPVCCRMILQKSRVLSLPHLSFTQSMVSGMHLPRICTHMKMQPIVQWYRNHSLRESSHETDYHNTVVVVTIQPLLDAWSTTCTRQGVQACTLVKAVHTPDSALMSVCLAVTTWPVFALSFCSSQDATSTSTNCYCVQSVIHI